MSVNRIVAQKWVDALRSGEFQQTTGKLGAVAADGSRAYCCLGVLCEVAVADGVIPPAYVSRADPDHPILQYEAQIGSPGPATHKYFWNGGLRDEPWFVATPQHVRYEPDGEMAYEDDEIGLTTLNDAHRLNFNQIADAIEATHLATVPA